MAWTFLSQEYEGRFVSFSGRIYYQYESASHTDHSLTYNDRHDLAFCFDFNVSPGVCAICQEQEYGGRNPNVAASIHGVIGEVWIPRNSTTPAVCNRLIQDWGDHSGDVYIYGDATGGARGTAKVDGSDWDLIKAHLSAHFGSRLKIRVPKANPRERVRVNSVNSRLKSSDNTIHMLVDPNKAPHVCKDFEGVRVLEGSAGQIDKGAAKDLSHISDALGYYIEKEFPVAGKPRSVDENLPF
jgi:hypothetical protein